MASDADRLGTIDRLALTECEEGTLHKSKTLDRALRSNALFVLLLVLVLVLSIAVLVLVLSIAVLVLEAIQCSNPAHWPASSRELPRSTIGIAEVQTAIEYEYRFTEYRFAEYEYDEIRCEGTIYHFDAQAAASYGCSAVLSH